MPNRRTPRRRARRVPTTTGTSHNANSGVLTQEVIEQASQAALERGGSVSEAFTMNEQTLRDLTRALEIGSYNVAPSNLQQGAVLQVEDLSTISGTTYQIGDSANVWGEYMAPVPRESARLAAVEEMSEIIRGFKKK